MRYCLICIFISCEDILKNNSINTAPVINTIEIDPEIGIVTSSLLTCTASATDSENDTLSYIVQWNKANGQLLTSTSELQLTPEIVSPLEDLTCTVTVEDGELSITEMQSVTVENTVPVISEITITPQTIQVDSLLQCAAEMTDADLESLSVGFSWTRNGEEVGLESSLQLDSENYVDADVIACTVTVEDEYQGVATDTVEVMVANTAPLIESVMITPAEPYSIDTLECIAQNLFDLEGDEVSLTYQWMVDGTLQAEQGSNLSSGFSVGNVVQCQITPNDGKIDGNLVGDDVTILNTDPVMDSIEITPNTNVEADSLLICEGLASDIDNDSLSLLYEWTDSNGTAIASNAELQLNPTTIFPDETLTCTATATDPHGASVILSASITVVNTVPVVVSTAQISGAATTTSTLTCSASFSDINDGILLPIYEWTLMDGTVLNSSDSYVVDANQTEVGQDIFCTASVIDSDGASISSTTNVLLLNTLPIVSAVSLSPDPGYSMDSLFCAVGGSSDIDDQALSLSYSWTVDSVLQAENSNTLSSPFAVGSVVGCSVTANDGIVDGIPETTSLTVSNTLPSVEEVLLSPSIVYTDEIISAQVSLLDIDSEQTVTAYLDWHVIDLVNNIDNSVQQGNSTTLDGAYFNRGDQVYVIVTPNDGVGQGVALTSSSLVVSNSTPDQAVVNIVSSSAAVPQVEADDLSCTITQPSSDADNDVLQYSFEWIDPNGDQLQTNTTSSMVDVLLATNVRFPGEYSCVVTPSDGTLDGPSSEAIIEVIYDCNCPTTTIRDYGYTYWPENFRYPNFNQHGFHTERHFLTGYYGAIIDMTTGNLAGLGSADAPVDAQTAIVSDDSWIETTLGSEVVYSVEINGIEWEATDFLNSDETGTHAADNPSMLMDMGRFMQHIDIPEVLYQGNTDLEGSLMIASMPQHLVLTHRVESSFSYNSTVAVRINLLGDLWQQAQVDSFLDGNRAMQITDSDGVSWIIVAPDSADVIQQNSDGTITIERTIPSLGQGDEIQISVLLLPANLLSEAQIDLYLDPESVVQVSYAQLNQSDGQTTSIQQADWDWERGAFTVPLGSISGSGASSNSPNWSNGTDFNIYNRHHLWLSHSESENIHVPLFLDGPINSIFYITGGAPLFRDINEEPLGLPIQVSKNWHMTGYWPNWFHLYSTPSIPSGSHQIELTIANGKWGETYAASHAQLSLVGWGTNQQWDESALGAWGESITYDPDKTLRRAMVDDVRPFLVRSVNEWSWSGNVGGADFLKYYNLAGQEQGLQQLKSNYVAPGPTMTDVVYGGVTADGAIAMTVRTHLVRTDDMVRAYYVLHYDFLMDVEYSRLGLFQVAADNYADNGFSRYAYGDESTVLFDQTVPNHGTRGYASNSDRGIAISGDSPWVFMYDSTKTGGNLPEQYADVGFIVRDYEANINGGQLTTPHINIIRTYNGSWSQMAFELALPYDPANPFISMGSSIDAVVEYVVVPNDISRYYGSSTDMLTLSSSVFGNTDIMEYLAAANDIEIVSSVGVTLQEQPTLIQAVEGILAAQFEMSGGFGYSPLTISGLHRADGWSLERWENGAWTAIDQSVHDNDFWQSAWDESTQSYSLTFSVQNDGSQEYRLIR